jgi:hypothetical protein
MGPPNCLIPDSRNLNVDWRDRFVNAKGKRRRAWIEVNDYLNGSEIKKALRRATGTRRRTTLAYRSRQGGRRWPQNAW